MAVLEPSTGQIMLRSPFSLPVLLLLVLPLFGCEEDVVMVVGTERPFSLYGVLNPRTDTQFVFVFPIHARMDSLPSEVLDARFTSVDLQTGEEREWADSVFRNPLGLNRHVYWSAFNPEYDHTYRLEVVDGGGVSSRLEVPVPPLVEVMDDVPVVSLPDVRQPVRLVSRAPRLHKIEVTFQGRIPGGLYHPDIPREYRVGRVTIPYDGRQHRSGDEWVLYVDLVEGHKAIVDWYKKRYPKPNWVDFAGIELMQVRLDVIVADETWDPPGGVFDSLAMVHPEVMTNVEDGFGFVGGGYRIDEGWIVVSEYAEAAGFNPVDYYPTIDEYCEAFPWDLSCRGWSPPDSAAGSLER